MSKSSARAICASEVRLPPMYRVVLVNDDYTTFDFVIEVLQLFFHKRAEEARSISLKIHQEGSGIVGVYPRDLAETKSQHVNAYARKHGHPLVCRAEQE